MWLLILLIYYLYITYTDMPLILIEISNLLVLLSWGTKILKHMFIDRVWGCLIQQLREMHRTVGKGV